MKKLTDSLGSMWWWLPEYGVMWHNFLGDLGYEFVERNESWDEFELNGFTFRLDLREMPQSMSFNLSGPRRNDLPSVIWRIKREDSAVEVPELLSVLKAVADPSLAPLCVSVDWAKKFVAYMKNEFYTVKYWNDYFTNKGWENLSDEVVFKKRIEGTIVYGKNKIYIFMGVYENFVNVMFKIIENENYTTDFPCVKQFQWDTAEEFDLLIRAVTDPTLVPLCLGIRWAKSIVNYLLEGLV